MRVIFVGVHNKAGKEPLDSSTVSGKRIDTIINKLHRVECIKTNLWEVEYFPKDKVEKVLLIEKWFVKYWENKDDIIVLLGSVVHYSFPKYILGNIIKLSHPSLQFSKLKPTDYIDSAVLLINNKLNLVKQISMI